VSEKLTSSSSARFLANTLRSSALKEIPASVYFSSVPPRSRSRVSPIETSEPSCSRVLRSTGLPSTKVPLWLPKSTISKAPEDVVRISA
jgi:hypothetical protein